MRHDERNTILGLAAMSFTVAVLARLGWETGGMMLDTVRLVFNTLN